MSGPDSLERRVTLLAILSSRGELNLQEYLTSRECCLVIRGLLHVQLTKALRFTVIKTLEDLDARAKKQAKLEHTVKWGFVGVLLSWLGNFGLVWAV